MIETITIETVQMECGQCGVVFWLTKTFYDELRHTNKGTTKGWYCPNGHGRIFGENDLMRTTEELQEAKRKLANVQFELMAAEKKIKRVERKIKNGVCPCCHRQFASVARHMKSKHPDYAEG